MAEEKKVQKTFKERMEERRNREGKGNFNPIRIKHGNPSERNLKNKERNKRG